MGKPSRKDRFRLKGQTTMILMVMVVLIFGGLILFLLGFAAVVSESAEYENLYVHNMLLSTLRTDTGYIKDDCRTLSDLFMCAFTTNTFCGTRGLTCQDILNDTLTYYMDRFFEARPGHRFLFIAEPASPDWVPLDQYGRPLRFVFGNETLEKARIKKLSANQRIQKESYVINVRLLMAKR